MSTFYALGIVYGRFLCGEKSDPQISTTTIPYTAA